MSKIIITGEGNSYQTGIEIVVEPAWKRQEDAVGYIFIQMRVVGKGTGINIVEEVVATVLRQEEVELLISALSLFMPYKK